MTCQAGGGRWRIGARDRGDASGETLADAGEMGPDHRDWAWAI